MQLDAGVLASDAEYAYGGSSEEWLVFIDDAELHVCIVVILVEEYHARNIIVE